MTEDSNDKGKGNPIIPQAPGWDQDKGYGQGGGGGSEDALFTTQERHRGVILRRVFAYIIDIVILTAVSYALATLLIILTLGLALFVIGAVIFMIALAYHTFFIGRNAATPGMSFLGLEVRDYYSGRPPSYGQAFLATLIFYLSVIVTFWIVLLVPIFTKHNRTLHDLLSGTILLRREA